MDEITRAHIHVATQIAGTDREVTKPDYPLDALQQSASQRGDAS